MSFEDDEAAMLREEEDTKAEEPLLLFCSCTETCAGKDHSAVSTNISIFESLKQSMMLAVECDDDWLFPMRIFKDEKEGDQMPGVTEQHEILEEHLLV
jgi:hypothetical protein